MNTRLEDRNRAIELRRQGKSYREIQSEVKASKGMLSLWLSSLSLTSDEQDLLQRKIEERKGKGRMNSKIINQARMLERERRLIKDAEAMFKKRKGDVQFLLGLSLFWAKGSKDGNGVHVSSTDTDMIFYLYAWMPKYLSIGKEKVKIRLFVEEGPNSDSIRDFWAKNLKVRPDTIKLTIQKRKSAPIKNNPYFKGCVRLSVIGVKYAKSMKAWQKLCIEYYGKALLSGK